MIDKLVNKYNNIEVKRLGNKQFEINVLDPNQASWDVYDDYNTTKTNNNMYGDDPKNYISENDIVAIDFGTSSTVVVIDTDDVKTLEYVGEMTNTSRNYRRKEENPTILQFKDFKTFKNDYLKDSSRPKTKVEDLAVSWIAFNNFKDVSSGKNEKVCRSNFYNKIKQWTSTDEGYIRIIDDKNNIFKLYNFREKNLGEIDLIELYAYYLGSYINRLKRGKIFLRYYLSYPITFTQNIKKSVLESFKKGIIKSLPKSIITNEEIIKKISIKFKATEPLSYAITAFKAFDIKPVEDETILYSVYDFGGGTTDFEYGLLRNTKGDKKIISQGIKYDILKINTYGMPYLGGENIIEELAIYTILSSEKNKKVLRENNIRIEYPRFLNIQEYNKNEDIFDNERNSEGSSFKNLRILSKKIEEYWLDTINEDEKENSYVDLVEMFNLENKSIENITLEIKYTEIENKIKEIVRRGIKKFWEKYIEYINNVNNNTEYKAHSRKVIFLAGNSTKSKIFIEEFKKIYNIIVKKNPEMLLYYPISEENTQVKGSINEKFGININGKNGVAYGLTLLIDNRTDYRQLILLKEQEQLSNLDKNLKFPYIIKKYPFKEKDIIISPDTPINQWKFCYYISEEDGEDLYKEIELGVEQSEIFKVKKYIIYDKSEMNKYLYIKALNEYTIQFSFLDNETTDQVIIENNKKEKHKYTIEMFKI